MLSGARGAAVLRTRAAGGRVLTCARCPPAWRRRMDRPAAGARTHVLRPPATRGTAAAARAALHRSGRAAAVCGAAAGAHATALHRSTASLHAQCGTAIADLECPPALLLARRIQLDFEHTIAKRCGRRLRVGAFGQRDGPVEAAVAPLAAVVAALIRRLLLLAL